MNRLLITLFWGLLIFQSSYSQNIQDSLVAFYPFDGNAKDKSGNGNHGTVFGANLIEDRFGNPSSAYEFNGIDDYIWLGGNSNIRPRHITVAGWFNSTSEKSGADGMQFIIRSRLYGYSISLNPYRFSDGYEHIGGIASVLALNTQDQYVFYSREIIYNDGKWHFVALSYNGIKTTFYIDGQLVYQNDSLGVGEIYYEFGGTSIGRDGDYNSRYFEGSLDDFRIYNRALSEDEILSLADISNPFNSDFIADTTSGFDSLTVKFTNQSTSADSSRPIILWAWDFENDGIIDSDEQHPVWTYKNPGKYTVKLTVSDSLSSATEIKENYITIHSIVIANFDANIKSGAIPHEVQFSDSSTGNINTWQWDFENDGIIDSYKQNPVFTYFEADTFSIKLIISNDVFSDTLTKEDFITTFFDTIPNLYKIEDIPDDQGGWVKVNFAKSLYDSDSLIFSKASSSELYTVEINDGSGWTAAVSTVAYGKSLYSVLTPTTKDSTSENLGIIEFRIIAGMDEGNFVSDIIPGYSVDNLKPAVPTNLTASSPQNSEVILNWDANTEDDFRFFSIYRTSDGLLIEKIGETIEAFFSDRNIHPGQNYSYAIKSTDHSGNLSNYSDWASITITNLENPIVPAQYYLAQNYPNPFNPLTTIKYGVLKPGNVRIIIYDVMGNEIKELINQDHRAGQHQIIWNGTNNQNVIVSTGIYYYQIITKNFKQIRKMLFVK